MRLLSAKPSSCLAGLALCSLLAASCGDTDGAAGDDGASPDIRAASVNLQLTDLPAGYEAIPPPDGEEDKNLPLEGCFSEIDDAVVADAASPTYGLATGASLRFVSSKTFILTESDVAERLLASAQEQTTLDCLSTRLEQAYVRLLPQATIETALTLAPDPEFPDVGAASVGLTGSATFTSEGGTSPTTVATSLVLVQNEDALSVLLFGGLLEPFPPETIRSVTTTVAERLA